MCPQIQQYLVIRRIRYSDNKIDACSFCDLYGCASQRTIGSPDDNATFNVPLTSGDLENMKSQNIDQGINCSS